MPEETVLIVDDDVKILAAFTPLLRTAGYVVHVALDGRNALAQVEAMNPSAIVIDLHLPVVDGIAFLRRLRATPAHAAIPVAVITGDYMIDDHVSGDLQQLGASLFFKPLWRDELVTIVRALIDRRPARAACDRDALVSASPSAASDEAAASAKSSG